MRSAITLTFLCLFVASAFGQVGQAAIDANDLATLQYALTLENIEADFYTRGQITFNAQAFVTAGYSASDYSYFTLIRDHEISHANFLAGVITSLKGTPVTSCNGTATTSASGYNYAALGRGDPFASVANYIAVAAALEPLGTNAYVTAATFISSKAYLQAAATIATVEGRHAQYVLRLYNKTVPTGPDSTFPIQDLGLTVASVVTSVTSLSSECATKLVTAVGGNANLPTNLFVDAQRAATIFSIDSTINANSQLASSANLTANDYAVLQYALYLEYFEAAFYAAAVGVPGTTTVGAFTSAQFQAAGYGPEVYLYLQLVSAHETAHVNTLTTALGTAFTIPACTYNFTTITTGTVQNFINTAAKIEPVGVSAYDGVANALTNRGFLAVAAGIATVEARHASILASFALNVSASSDGIVGPFPNVRDIPLNPAVVRQQVLGLGLLTETPSTCRPTVFPAQVYNQQSVVGASPTVARPTPTAGATTPGGNTNPTSVNPTARTTTNSAAFATVSAVVMIVVAVLAL